MKGFLEEYGLIIVVVSVIMVMLLLGTTVGAQVKDNIVATVGNFLTVAEQVYPDLDNPGGESNQNEYVEILAPTNINCIDIDGVVTGTAIESSTIVLEEGNTYKVVWDNVDYECIATKIFIAEVNFIALGNLSFNGLGTNTSEPFLIGYITGGLEIISSEGAHTVAIYEKQ